MRDFLAGLFGGSSVSSSEVWSPDDPEIERMARNARGETVTPETLANEFGRSRHSVLSYLDDAENPEYIVRGSEVMIVNDDDQVTRSHPTRETQVVLSDERVLFVVGGTVSDEIWVVPYDDLVDVYLDEVDHPRKFLVIDANREGNPMTFYTKVTLEPAVEEIRRAIDLARRKAGIHG